VNHFQAAGGMSLLIRELLKAGLLHADVTTITGPSGLERYLDEPFLDNGALTWRPGPERSLDPKVVASAEKPFSADGGLKMLDGNLGHAVIKISAVKPEHRFVEAPAKVFTNQNQLIDAFKNGELQRDVVAVVTFQGPKANGMPELHKLTPSLGVLQDQGFHVALVTDGRMSGASGKVPAAIHVTPESADGGPLARVRDGDMIRLDSEKGTLEVLVDAATLAARELLRPDLSGNDYGVGRELFGVFRDAVGDAESGASVFKPPTRR
jgi:phosphogluconate dehydratase